MIFFFGDFYNLVWLFYLKIGNWGKDLLEIFFKINFSLIKKNFNVPLKWKFLFIFYSHVKFFHSKNIHE